MRERIYILYTRNNYYSFTGVAMDLIEFNEYFDLSNVIVKA